jgi:hypothetical protein
MLYPFMNVCDIKDKINSNRSSTTPVSSFDKRRRYVAGLFAARLGVCHLQLVVGNCDFAVADDTQFGCPFLAGKKFYGPTHVGWPNACWLNAGPTPAF